MLRGEFLQERVIDHRIDSEGVHDETRAGLQHIQDGLRISDLTISDDDDGGRATRGGVVNEVEHVVERREQLGASSVSKLPPVYCGDVLFAAFHHESTEPIDSELLLSAKNRNGELKEWILPFTPTSNLALELLWAKEQIDEHLRHNRKNEAVKLACQFNISCPGAAWVTWDETKQQAADVLVNQPSLHPHQ